jgi:hypothetical protein
MRHLANDRPIVIHCVETMHRQLSVGDGAMFPRITALGLVVVLLAAAPARPVDAFQLVTAEEARAGAVEDRMALTTAPADPRRLPSVLIDQPQQDNRYTAPLDIRLRFVPSPGARIDPASFRAYYGLFRLDITQRILQNARLTDAGLIASGAKIPAGSHRIQVQIADTAGLVSQHQFSFVIDPP